MASESNVVDRARDELFSHINRCGVLQAAEDDQKQWMDETIDYIGERYPGLTESNLRDLYVVGLRFCKPVIMHGVASRGASAMAEAPKSIVSNAGEAAGETAESSDVHAEAAESA